MPDTSHNYSVAVRPPVWALLSAVFIGGCFYLFGASVLSSRPIVMRSADQQSQISVSGEGKVTANPDIAVLSFGVRIERQASAKIAMTKLADIMNAVVAATKAKGIDSKDVQTQQLSLSPEYDYVTGRQMLRGYSAMQNLSVKVRDLDAVGDVLSAVTQAGANQADGVSFTIDHPEKLQADARKQAIDMAKAKAQVLADQLGVRLGRIVSFSEGTDGSPPRPYMMEAKTMAFDAAAGSSVPVPAGQQDIHSTVTIVYELE